MSACIQHSRNNRPAARSRCQAEPRLCTEASGSGLPLGDRIGLVPRPNLLGAIVLKACAIAVDDAPQDQRRDLAFLLSLVSAPYEMAAEMTNKDRTRLRRNASSLTDSSHPAWIGIVDAADAIAALHALLDD